MKYCPFCGVSLPGDAASFCPECGKALRQRKHSIPEMRRRQPPASRRSQRPPQMPKDEHYDGYYNDVRPIDADRAERHHDPKLAQQVAYVIAGAIGVIILAVILMFVL